MLFEAHVNKLEKNQNEYKKSFFLRTDFIRTFAPWPEFIFISLFANNNVRTAISISARAMSRIDNK